MDSFNIESYITSGTKEQGLVLWALSDFRAYTAQELANYANLSLERTKTFLKTLQKNHLLYVLNNRRPYYRLANASIAHAVDKILIQKEIDKPKLYKLNPKLFSNLHYCRSCYQHLAGKVGVELTMSLQAKGIIVLQKEKGMEFFTISQKGEGFFNSLQIDLQKLKTKNIFIKNCLDFSERKYHLGGALGVALLKAMIDKEWFIKNEPSRILYPTKQGKYNLKRLLGMRF